MTTLEDLKVDKKGVYMDLKKTYLAKYLSIVKKHTNKKMHQLTG